MLPSFLALPVLAALLSLGLWQVQRIGWKTALLEQLAVAQAGPPQPAVRPAPFAHIIATGRFRHDQEVFLGTEVRGPVLGTTLVTPLEREGLPTLLVHRGWVPLNRAGVLRPEGEVTLQGFMHPSETAGRLAASDSPAQRHFHTFNPAAIGAALGIPVAPFGLAVVTPGAMRATGGLGAAPAPNDGPLPSPAHAFPQPENPHLGYAITWFGLAAAWIAIFALWAARLEPDRRSSGQPDA